MISDLLRRRPTEWDASAMSHGLIDAVSDERIEEAVDRTLRLRAEQDGTPLGSLAWAALVAGVLQRAERHLNERTSLLIPNRRS